MNIHNLQKRLFLLSFTLLLSLATTAHDFEVDGIYYNITSSSNFTVSVTYQGSTTSSAKYTGDVVIPEKVTFNSIEYSVTSIADKAFSWCSGMTSITIPNTIESIGKSAFYDCRKLTSVNIPNSVTSISQRGFFGCGTLTSVTLSNSLKTIEKETFENCSALASITIPENVTNIDDEAFMYCSALKSIYIPESVTRIGQNAFGGCPNVNRVDCQATTPPLAYSKTFTSAIYTKATLNVPEGCTEKYQQAEVWKEFTNITVDNSKIKQCAAPVITYADGKLQFTCETEGAKFRYILTTADTKSSFQEVDGSVDLTACYDIKAYALAVGYTNSEEVKATLCWIGGSDVSTNINTTEMRGIIVSCSGGIITVSGLEDNETVMFYDAEGKLLYSGVAQNRTISYASSTTGVIIVKIGKSSIKVAC